MWYIYRVYSDIGPLQYYGSTKNIHQRWLEHKSTYKLNKPNRTVLNVLNAYSYDNCNIEIVEEIELKENVKPREKYWIINNECVNKQIPTNTLKDWKIINREHVNSKSREWKQKQKQK
jgi:predicted GIY-YIG superfamily endonuclease